MHQEDLDSSLTWRETDVYTAVGEHNVATMHEQPKKKQKKAQPITAEHPIAPMPVQQVAIQVEAAVHLPDRHVQHRATHTPISERLKRVKAAIQVEEPVHPIASKTSGSTAPVEFSNAENVRRGRKRQRPTEADLEDNDDATTTAEHGAAAGDEEDKLTMGSHEETELWRLMCLAAADFSRQAFDDTKLGELKELLRAEKASCFAGPFEISPPCRDAPDKIVFMVTHQVWCPYRQVEGSAKTVITVRPEGMNA